MAGQRQKDIRKEGGRERRGGEESQERRARSLSLSVAGEEQEEWRGDH